MASPHPRKARKPRAVSDEQINEALMMFYTAPQSQRVKLAEKLVNLSQPIHISDLQKAYERRDRFQQALVLQAQAKFEEKPTSLRAKKFAFTLGKYRGHFSSVYFNKMRQLAYGHKQEHKETVEKELRSIGADRY